MAPKRYFYVRGGCTWHYARCARQITGATTVTEIATRLGFWEFGRFSVHYKALFGETPSATLRKEGKSEFGNHVIADALSTIGRGRPAPNDRVPAWCWCQRCRMPRPFAHLPEF